MMRTLQDVLPKLTVDLLLNHIEAVASLVEVAIHEIVRFSESQRYPGRIWKLSRKYNGPGCLQEISFFLTCNEALLDYGWGVPTRRAAYKGDVPFAVAQQRMLDKAVQDEIDNIVEVVYVNSLDGERKNAICKPPKNHMKDRLHYEKTNSCRWCRRSSDVSRKEALI